MDPIAFSGKDNGRDNIAPTLRAMNNDKSNSNGGGQLAVLTKSDVRRLTPIECERLQGYEDDYTLVPYRGGKLSDSQRYAALGNSMAVPVISWIGRRIAAAIEGMP